MHYFDAFYEFSSFKNTSFLEQNCSVLMFGS